MTRIRNFLAALPYLVTAAAIVGLAGWAWAKLAIWALAGQRLH